MIASLFATLNDTYGNRTICGIGRGDSARRYIGLAQVSLDTLGSARLAELESIGCDQFAVHLMHDDEDATFGAYGSEIIRR